MKPQRMSHRVLLARNLEADLRPDVPVATVCSGDAVKLVHFQILVRRRDDQGEQNRPKVRWAKARNPWKRPRG
jgi:hypothetical protein